MQGDRELVKWADNHLIKARVLAHLDILLVTTFEESRVLCYRSYTSHKRYLTLVGQPAYSRIRTFEATDMTIGR